MRLPSGLQLPMCDESLHPVLADRLQHPQAWLLSLLLGLLQQALVDERGDPVQHRVSQASRSVTPGSAYRIRCFPCAACNKDGVSPIKGWIRSIHEVDRT